MKTPVKKHLVTFFRNHAAKTLTAERTTLTALRDRILTTTADAKPRLPWLKMARFGDRCEPGSTCLRNNANVISVSGVEADYDGEVISFDKAVRTLKKARVRALVYTSPSHSKAKPRWRILAPTSKSLPPKRRAQLVARLNGLFDGAFGDESFVLSQSYYFGSVRNKRSHRAVIVAGTHIDKRRDLDPGAIGKPARQVSNSARGQIKKNTEPKIERELLIAALEATPADDYYVWLNNGAALYHEFGDDAGFEVFDRWSATCREKYDAGKTRAKWFECEKLAEYYTGATILFNANLASPKWRSVFTARRWAQFSFALGALR